MDEASGREGERKSGFEQAAEYIAGCVGGAVVGEYVFSLASGPGVLTGIPEVVGPAIGCVAGVGAVALRQGDTVDAAARSLQI
jgi:hypothetical protein